VIGVDASEQFSGGSWRGVSDPEQRRSGRLSGVKFITTFAAEGKREKKKRRRSRIGSDGNIKFLVQGNAFLSRRVLNPCRLKGPSGDDQDTSQCRRTAGENMPFALVEDRCGIYLRMRCRRIGKDLGLPEEILVKHPFPGPGAGGCGCLARLRKKDLETLREAEDAIVVEEIRRGRIVRESLAGVLRCCYR